MPNKKSGKSFAKSVIKHEKQEMKERKSCNTADKKVILQAKQVLKKK